MLSGEFLARLHQQTSDLQIPYNRKEYSLNTLLYQPIQVIAPAFEGFPEGYTWLQETAAATEKELEQLNTGAFSYGYCHYDFMPKNWHHDQQGAITLFDFDFSGKGWLANDIASYTVYLNLMNLSAEETARRLQLFITAYQTIKPLHPDELKALPALSFLFWVFYLGYQYENFEDHTNVYFGPRYLRERVKTMQHHATLIASMV